MRLLKFRSFATIVWIRIILAAGTRLGSSFQYWVCSTDAEFLRAALLEAARTGDAVAGEAEDYGERYTVDFRIARADRDATVRSAWIILRGESAPRLTICFVL